MIMLAVLTSFSLVEREVPPLGRLLALRMADDGTWKMPTEE
jgi:hypothetical protein